VALGVVMMDDSLTADQIARALNVRHATVCRWLTIGRLEGRKVESEWRIRRDDFERFLARRARPLP
jgi:excisionase family DNA binding protein